MTDYFAKPSHGAAWVTGASSGIGRAVAMQLADEGFTVFATARGEEALVKVACQANVLKGHIVPMPGDVTDSNDMARIVDTIERQHGALALAVLNAGVQLPVHGEALEIEDFEATFAVNVVGVVKGLVPAVDAMKRAGRGQIVIVSSVTGYGGLPTSAAYGASMAALINMAESLKFDLDKLAIRIQIVNPGFVDMPEAWGSTLPIPALTKVEEAARELVAGLKKGGFEITFPKRFSYKLKLMRLLPYALYFRLVNRSTGWNRRPLQSDYEGEPGINHHSLRGRNFRAS